MFKLACGDVMPGCAARFESSDRTQLMGQVTSHAAAVHGLTSLSADTMATIESKIYAAA
jgi:predicted small metal-binding protein